MTRAVARELAVQIGFASDATVEGATEALNHFLDKEYFKTLVDENDLFAEYPSNRQKKYIKAVVIGVAEHRDELDGYINKYTKGWKLERISKISQVIMKTAMYEALYLSDVPESVAVNEAIKIAKGYEEQETVSFINGILGSFIRGEIDKLDFSEVDANDVINNTEIEQSHEKPNDISE